ncbi:MAG: hypothetical protein KC561_20015, partial [Myxococcales bacterium]|nr:hypothetical protein [Myxococcales bacterium]
VTLISPDPNETLLSCEVPSSAPPVLRFERRERPSADWWTPDCVALDQRTDSVELDFQACSERDAREIPIHAVISSPLRLHHRHVLMLVRLH